MPNAYAHLPIQVWDWHCQSVNSGVVVSIVKGIMSFSRTIWQLQTFC